MPEHLSLIHTDSNGTLWAVQTPYAWKHEERTWMAGPCGVCGAFGLVMDGAASWPAEHVHYCYRKHQPTETPELAAYDEAWE